MQVAEGARARGASKIIGVDINPSKFSKGILYIYISQQALFRRVVYEIVTENFGNIINK